MNNLEQQIKALQHEYAGDPVNHSTSCECSICEFPRRINKLITQQQEELLEKAFAMIRTLPTENDNDGGVRLLSEWQMGYIKGIVLFKDKSLKQDLTKKGEGK